MRHRGLFVALAVFLALSAGWVGFQTLTGGDEPVERATVQVPVVTGDDHSRNTDGGAAVSGPTGDSSGVPVGYVRTAAGARAAAVGWVSSLGSLMRLGPIATADTLRALTTARVAAATIDALRAERDQFTERFGADPSRAIWIDAPLAVDVAEWSPDRAVVRVWAQLVVGAPTGAAVQAMWRTHTVTLLWEGEDWRVDDVTRIEGPTPQVTGGDLPSTGSDFAAVAEWTPAVLAGSSVGGT